jgi:hypothetical protein
MTITISGNNITYNDSTIQVSAYDLYRAVTVSGSTTSIDLSTDQATLFRVSVGASTTLTFSNPTQGKSWTVITTNSGSGYTITWGNSVKWAGGITPPRTTASGAVDIWTFYYDNSVYYGSLAIANAS